ncbi:MAG: succinyl-diaminopimelate desuccinylase [Rhodobacteraceae bacterium]|nr:succinyl-diaminopimelate desuccinylase [Paracoccaceae bacterium]
MDAVELTAGLVRCRSITPAEGGALTLLERVLTSAGFQCVRVDRGGVCNLFARWGRKGHPRSFGFNGHTDVVPEGERTAWSHAPFGAEIHQGLLYGRGAVDMKSGIAAFVAAAVECVTHTPPDGAILLAITGDEEGEATHGTRALLDYMARQQERMALCLVGEPTCPDTMGEMIKIGRRGALNAFFTFTGVQGHSAYPQRARNPLGAMARLMATLECHEIDQGSAQFEPSTLAIVAMDTGNAATNVIPATARAAVNVRFNDLHSGASLDTWLREMAAQVANCTGIDIEVRSKISGEAFLGAPQALIDLLTQAIKAELGRVPVLSTSGGTSDARFIKEHCPVAEFGLVGRTMHQIDEHVPIVQIRQLQAIYRRVLESYFAQ